MGLMLSYVDGMGAIRKGIIEVLGSIGMVWGGITIRLVSVGDVSVVGAMIQVPQSRVHVYRDHPP